MDTAILLMLGVAVFGASLLQAATGIGYGVIAGPILLVFLNGSEAFQISTIHNLLIAVLIFPLVRSGINHSVLKFLILGSSVGLFFGFWLQLTVDVIYLKIASMMMVMFVTAMLIHGMRTRMKVSVSPTLKPNETSIISVLAGTMGGMLAMPGPLAATWMSLKGFAKQEVRATILAFFIFIYGATLALYLMVSGIEAETIMLSIKFAPVVILGVLAGNMAAKLLSERLFRFTLLVILLATLILLMTSILSGD